MTPPVRVRPMASEDLDGVVALQPEAFPPPFDPSWWWRREHLIRHRELFPEGQFVAVDASGAVVGSCSNTRLTEAVWAAHGSWDETVGGPFLETFAPDGTVLYGLDVSVAERARGRGVGRALYAARFALVRSAGLERYGTACRMPDLAASGMDPEAYAAAVVRGDRTDRTLTPLLRMGLRFNGVLRDHMEDPESLDSAALLEWTP